MRRGWRDPCEWSGLLGLCGELSRPAAAPHLTGAETGPPTGKAQWTLEIYPTLLQAEATP